MSHVCMMEVKNKYEVGLKSVALVENALQPTVIIFHNWTAKRLLCSENLCDLLLHDITQIRWCSLNE